MKKLFFVFLGFLIISSCKEKDKKNVPIAVESISFPSSATPLTLKVGGTSTLTPTILPENAFDKSIAWESSDATVATVSENGVVTGMKVGSAIITAKSKSTPSKTATRAVTVATLPVSTITLTSNPATLALGGSAQLTATVAPENASNKAVTWNSSDPSKATVDNNGLARGIARGSVTITATANDGSAVKGEITFTVKSADATVSAITLGAENFVVAVPAEGATTTITNAPRTVFSDPSAVRVNITAADGATIKIATEDFTSGRTANFTNAVTFTVTAEDGTIKTYTVAITAYNAATNPYGIYTVVHLNDVRYDKGGSYKMMNNITLPERNATGATATGIPDYADKGWLPIAHDATTGTTRGFTGTFDGENFSINNFYTNRIAETVGLFGELGSGGTIRNLGINGVSGTAATGTSGGSNCFVGILAGRSFGTIDKCYATGSVFADSAGKLGNIYAGGLVGSSAGDISNSYATGSASSSASFSDSFAGGLAGSSAGDISNSYATGSVSALSSTPGESFAGGLAGLIKNITTSSITTVSNSYAIGSVSASTVVLTITPIHSVAIVWGLTGSIANATYTNCFRNSEATLTRRDATTTSDDATFAGITAKTIADMQDRAFLTLLNAGATVWGQDRAKNNGLPFIIGVGKP